MSPLLFVSANRSERIFELTRVMCVAKYLELGLGNGSDTLGPHFQLPSESGALRELGLKPS